MLNLTMLSSRGSKGLQKNEFWWLPIPIAVFCITSTVAVYVWIALNIEGASEYLSGILSSW